MVWLLMEHNRYTTLFLRCSSFLLVRSPCRYPSAACSPETGASTPTVAMLNSESTRIESGNRVLGVVDSTEIQRKIRSSSRATGANRLECAGSPTRLDRLDDQLITNFHNDSQFELSSLIQEVFGNRGRDKQVRHAIWLTLYCVIGKFRMGKL